MTPTRTAKDSDEALLEALGYKQEFRRAFTSLEVSNAQLIFPYINKRRFH